MALLVAGDVMLAAGVDEHLPRVVENIRKIKAEFPEARLVANLECPVCRASVVARGFRADPQRCEQILRLFDVFSVANNHALDCGDEGLHGTVHFLQDLGVAVVGYRNIDGRQEGAVLSVSGTRVGFLGYVDEGLFVVKPSPILATCSDWGKVREEIKLLRESSDVVLCMLHAGEEMASFPVRAERTLPRRLLEYGADIVVRSHAHVVQGHEQIGSSLIFYGLGDFVFDAMVRRRRTCGMIYLSGVPLGSTWKAFLFHRERDFSMKCLEGRSLPGIPVSFDTPYRAIDKAIYYVERTFSLVREYGFGGALYGIRRLLGLRNNRRMV